MGLSFFERMQGHLVDPAGGVHPIDFELKAEADRTGHLLRTGEARLSGVLRVLPWAEAAPATGTLRFLPEHRLQLGYDLDFVDEQGEPCQLSGRKYLGPLKPLGGATDLDTRLLRGEVELAAGHMHFDLDDLLPFTASWRPTARRRLAADPGTPAEPGTPMAAAHGLTRTEQSLLAALAPALILPGGVVPPVDHRSIEGALDLVASMPPQVRMAWRAGLRALDLAAAARTGIGLRRLPLERRRETLADLATASGATRQLVALVGMPLKAGHFARPDYLEAVGMPWRPAPLPEAPARWQARVHAPEELEERTELEADVVVIGTGAGGGPVAAILAEAGLAVAMIEEGRFHGRADFGGSAMARMRALYHDGGLTFSMGSGPITIPIGRTVGGSTTVNSGTCFPTPPAVLRQWRHALGFPADFEPEAFAPYVQAALDELQATPADPKYLGRIAQVVGRGADAIGLPHGPLLRNAPGCDGQGECPMGCPTDAKRSTNVSYLPRALQAGAELFTGLSVQRLLLHGGHVVAVQARGTTTTGAVRRLTVRARAVVIAGGSLASPLLLGDNGIRLPMIGRNLSVHPGVGMMALCDEDLDPSRAIPQGYGVDGLESLGLRFEGYWTPPEIAAPVMPLEGAELTRWMDAFRRVGQFGFMVKDPGVGRVRRGPGGRPLVQYPPARATLDAIAVGSATLAEILLRGGASEVLTCIGTHPRVRTVEVARALASLHLQPHNLRLAAFHPLGTCRVGAGPKLGVTDFEHRVFGTDNLYVIDGSSVPTSLGVNPQITIMAMAHRAAERLAVRLG